MFGKDKEQDKQIEFLGQEIQALRVKLVAAEEALHNRLDADEESLKKYQERLDENIKEILDRLAMLDSMGIETRSGLKVLEEALIGAKRDLNGNDISLLKDVEVYKEENNLRIRKLNNFLDDRTAFMRENFDQQMAGLTKYVESRLIEVGDKEVVPGLLRKIAALESIKETVKNRRTTEEIRKKLSSLKEKRLRDDCKDKRPDPLLVTAEEALLFSIGESDVIASVESGS